MGENAHLEADSDVNFCNAHSPALVLSILLSSPIFLSHFPARMTPLHMSHYMHEYVSLLLSFTVVSAQYCATMVKTAAVGWATNRRWLSAALALSSGCFNCFTTTLATRE